MDVNIKNCITTSHFMPFNLKKKSGISYMSILTLSNVGHMKTNALTSLKSKKLKKI